jgi:L-lysine 6-transaminase
MAARLVHAISKRVYTLFEGGLNMATATRKKIAPRRKVTVKKSIAAARPKSDTGNTRATRLTPAQVFPTLKKHMLVDGFDFIVDLKQSKGSYLVDARTGKRYLDFFTFVASSPIGLNHPKMLDPDFIEKLAHVAVNKPSNSDIYTVEQAEFVDTFSRVAIPSYLPHLFLIEGGALAVENALKAAFDWKIRKNFERGYKEERGRQVIHFRQSFHGRSGYTLSLTNTDPTKTALFPKFSWPRVNNPAIRFPMTEESITRVKQAEEQSVAQMKEAFRTQRDDIAAIIIEPIQGEGGDNHFRPEFFAALRQLADENEAMLIVDEVQTGIGMTGKMWAHQHFVEPDMAVFGKKMQVCGFLCGRRIEEVKENVFTLSSRINSTWGGNLVDMVRAQRYLEIIEEDNLVENARVVGEYLLRKLQELASDYPAVVCNARGRGLFAAFDLVASDARTRIRDFCFGNGLIILPSGERSLRFRPPLTVTQEEIDFGLKIIRKAIAAV